MTQKYDSSRRDLLVSEEAELIKRLASVRQNIALEDSKTEAYNLVKRVAEKFPYVVIRIQNILDTCSRTEQYVLKSEYIECNPPTDSSNIEIRGLAMEVFTYHHLPPTTYVTIHENHDRYVELWCALVIKEHLTGLTREEMQKFIADCMKEAGDADPAKIQEAESMVL